MQSSLRWRLTLTFTALAIVAVLVHSVSLFLTVEEQEEALIDEVISVTLKQELQQPSRPLQFGVLQSLSSRMLLYRSRDGRQPPVLPVAYARYADGTYEWIDADIEYHVGIQRQGAVRLYLLYDERDHETRLRRLLWSIGVGVAVLSLLSLLIGHWLAGRVLWQLGRLMDRLYDDETQLEQPGLDREIALVAQRLDHYRQRNRELLAHEQEFTANVSHELRTPLTRIRTTAELMAEEAAGAERAAGRAQGIIHAVDELEANLRSLLFLARETQPARPRRLVLAEAVQQSLATLARDFDVQGVELHNEVAPGVEIDADPTLLRLLLDNLLRNALLHTPRGCIRLSWQAGELEVADTGQGIEEQHLHRVFERAYRADRSGAGQGLGLAIVRRICAAHGWTCSIDSCALAGHPERGTRVRVRLGGTAPSGGSA